MTKKFFGLFIVVLAFYSCKTIAQQPQLTASKVVTHEFAALPFAYDALEPYIDKMTMEIHYSRHHRAYFDNFIKSVQGTPLENMPMVDIFETISQQSIVVRNNGGGYWNHEFFWKVITPGGNKEPQGNLLEAINNTFGNFENFKKQFADAGMKRFGSGWAWLSVDKNGQLFISSTANQDNPYMNTETQHGTPILCIDVWEHAYYLKYQNKRADYLNAYWNVVNWTEVGKNYQTAIEKH